MIKFIPPKLAIVGMAFLMSLIMSGVISLSENLEIMGINLHAVAAWPLEWAKAWAVALPVAIIVLPLVRKIVGSFVKAPAAKE
jgi:hypothetical protein